MLYLTGHAFVGMPRIFLGKCVKKMRLDKYLKITRLIKRRTVANEPCDAGRR